MDHDATKLLVEIRAGRRSPAELFPLVYDELRRVGRRLMRRERPDHTLQTTALVNEAFVRLVQQDQADWQHRAHFLAVAARAMRRVLIDHARGKKRKKRGGLFGVISADSTLIVSDDAGGGVDLDVLDDALVRLARINPRAVDVLVSRVFGGMTVEETAVALGTSDTTVEREWRYARAWLRRELGDETAMPDAALPDG